MVSFIKTLTVLTAAYCVLPTPVRGYIYGMGVAINGTAGGYVTVNLYTAVFVQNYDNFGVIWGLTPVGQGCTSCVGYEIGWTNLIGDGAPTLPPTGSFTVNLPIPVGWTPGLYTLTAGIPYLVGASGQTGINYINSTVAVQASPPN